MKRWIRDIAFTLSGILVGALVGAWLAGFITIIKERLEWARERTDGE